MKQQKATAQEFCEKYQIGRTTFWRFQKMEGFPKPFRLGRAVRWDVDDVDLFFVALNGEK